MNPDTLYDFQVRTVEWLSQARDNGYGFKCDANVGLIGHEMGLGKTAIALDTIKKLIAKGKRIIICVPGSTTIQWQKQYEKWVNDLESDEFGSNALYAVRSSKDVIPRDCSIVISHNLMARVPVIEKLAAANFDGMVIDEIHKFGAHGTKRIKHLWALINLTESHFQDCRIGLSGTPTRNYAKEIYNIAHFLAPDTFRVYEDFCRKYLTYDRKALWNPHQFHADFAPYYLRYMCSEVQKDLPTIRRTKMYTEITDPFIIKAYNNQLDLMSNFVNNAEKLDSFSLLGYLVKLRHITGIAKARESAIIEPIREYLTGDGDPTASKKVVIGIHHHLVADFLMKSLPEFPTYMIRGGQDARTKERIKNEFIACDAPAILLLSIKAGGEGMDGLQYAATKAYVFERQWNGADELQFEKRIHRTGQTQACQIEITIATGTVDEFFDDLIESKRRSTTQVEDDHWESNPVFLKTLAETVINNRLRMPRQADIEEFENMIRPAQGINENLNLLEEM